MARCLTFERVIPVPAQRLESGTKATARNRRRADATAPPTIRGVWRRFACYDASLQRALYQVARRFCVP